MSEVVKRYFTCGNPPDCYKYFCTRAERALTCDQDQRKAKNCRPVTVRVSEGHGNG